MQKKYNMPSLGALACFEATARHLSFKNASAELNVTPAAVSHRIKALEQEIGQPLFARKYRGVELTQNGALLFIALQRGFETISECVSHLRNHQNNAGVSIVATTAVNGLWLTQRLAAFWQINSDIAISQIVQDDDTKSGPDLSIHYGDPDEVRDETYILFKGRILALGTKEFSKIHNISNASDLLHAPLIHAQSADSHWTSWSEWFEQVDVFEPDGAGYWLNNYLISVMAAEDHVGAILGWEKLLEPYLDSGRLIQLVPESIEAPWPFYLRIHAGASVNARLFADWLVNGTKV